MWLQGSYQDRCTQYWCSLSLMFGKVARNQMVPTMCRMMRWDGQPGYRAFRLLSKHSKNGHSMNARWNRCQDLNSFPLENWRRPPVQDALVLCGWRLSSKSSNPITSPWMKQSTWLIITLETGGLLKFESRVSSIKTQVLSFKTLVSSIKTWVSSIKNECIRCFLLIHLKLETLSFNTRNSVLTLDTRVLILETRHSIEHNTLETDVYMLHYAVLVAHEWMNDLFVESLESGWHGVEAVEEWFQCWRRPSAWLQCARESRVSCRY